MEASKTDQPGDARPVQELPPGQKVGPAAHDGEEIPHDLKPPSGLAVVVVTIAFVLLLATLLVVGLIPHRREQAQTRREARDRAEAKPIAQWTHPRSSTGEQDVLLPCDVSANQQTAIYTRTNGYLKEWKFDIGQHVDQGQLMAVIATPEVDAQLVQSRASLAQAEANVKRADADFELARTTYDKYVKAKTDSPGSVSQEDLDTKKAALDDADAARNQVKASVDAANANVRQLETNVGFEQVTAPFSGTVTARNYDVGALLAPNATGAGKEIFDLAQTDLLRVYVNVPQTYANNVKKGQTARLQVRNFPVRKFEGTVTYTAGALDPTTRTLRVQVDFPNKDGDLFAGEYGMLDLPVTPQVPVARIPSSAFLFNAQGTFVSTLTPDNKIHLQKVTQGRDFGVEMEITSGLNTADRVVTNPGERVDEGAVVEPHEQPFTDPAPAPTTKPTT